MKNSNKYIESTSKFHSAEGYGEWMETTEYKDWFWAEFEAKYYVELLNTPSCFKDVMRTYHEFSEYYKTWSEAETIKIAVILSIWAFAYLALIF